MKFKLVKFMAIAKRVLWVYTRVSTIAFFCLAVVFTPFNSAIAGTVRSSTVETIKEAAQEVVKDTGAKEQFGKTESGDRLLDKAQEKANQKLNNLADKADSEEKLPHPQKRFVKNLSGQS